MRTNAVPKVSKVRGKGEGISVDYRPRCRLAHVALIDGQRASVSGFDETLRQGPKVTVRGSDLHVCWTTTGSKSLQTQGGTHFGGLLFGDGHLGDENLFGRRAVLGAGEGVDLLHDFLALALLQLPEIGVLRG